jgi:hypothetical protein
MKIGKLERVPLKSVWKHEAHDFTAWLQDNLDVLNGILGLDLKGAERERSAGAFRVDLVARDAQDNLVIIENQLEKSDHGHLGQLITYLKCMNAKAAIWIVSDPRPEHVEAINFLNSEIRSAEFYLVKLEALRIGGSEPAPLLTLFAGPSEEGRQIGRQREDLADGVQLRKEFWKGVQEVARAKKSGMHENVSPTGMNWLGKGAGMAGLAYNYFIREDSTSVDLYIDLGKEQADENERIFDKLHDSRTEIERDFGERLLWERMETKQACRVRYQMEPGGWRSPRADWPRIHAKMVDAMIRFERALAPKVKALRGA